MSAPTPAPGDESPREGYYPDPSIPGYVRYWNGASWVPGTSRPALQQGEPMPASPAGRQQRPQQPDSPVPSASSVPSVPSDPSVPAAASAETPMEETGPIFFDEEPQAGNRPEPATAWQADAARQAGFGGEHDRRVSWGAQPQPGAAPLPTGQGEPDGRTDSGLPSGPMPLPGSGDSGTSAVSGTSAAGPGPVPADRTPADGPSAERMPDDRVPVDPVPVDPVPVDPRRPASPAPADGALPGMRGGDDQVPENTVTLRAVDRGNRPPASRTPGQPPENGTMAIRPPSPGPGATGPAPRTPSTGPGPVPAQGPVSVPAAPANPNPNPVRSPAVPGPASAATPAPSPVAPANPGPGGAGTPWAQAHGNAQPAPAAPQQPQPQQPQPQQPQARQPQPQQPQAQQPQHHQQPQSPVQPPSHLQQPRLPHQAQQPHPDPQLGAAGGQQPDQPVTPWKPPVDDPFQQLARAQASARPAGPGKRFVARLVDTVVLGALVGAIGFPLVSRALDHIDAKIDAARMSGRTVTVWLVDPTTAGLFGAVLGAFLVLGVLLEALPTAKWGRTLGKKLCGLEVRDIESHESPSFGAALRRWLVYGVLGLLVIGVVNVLWCLFDRPWRQCWHDKAAHTFVAG
ncbi:RDD family protein [Streptomyces sp. NPDC002476]|uniref:RDD family protein n=1 Tax=Streptomyces sp. NPDC002476 TaxID=3364648 RepID=UPI0036CE0099